MDQSIGFCDSGRLTLSCSIAVCNRIEQIDQKIDISATWELLQQFYISKTILSVNKMYIANFHTRPYILLWLDNACHCLNLF